MSYVTKTFGPAIKFSDGTEYSLNEETFFEFIYENLVTEELECVDDRGNSTIEYIFKDPESGNLYAACAYRDRDSVLDFPDMKCGEDGSCYIKCFQVKPVEKVVIIYVSVEEAE
jgi:hypothetical protein